jgi:hypothetical protein
MKPNWGGEGAVGFDWRFAPVWHFSGQFRYGSATRSRNFATHIAGTVGTSPFSVTAVGNENLRDDHWLVDFAVGRDFGLGNSNAQWTFGFRIADLRSKLSVNANISGTANGSATVTPRFPGRWTAIRSCRLDPARGGVEF